MKPRTSLGFIASSGILAVGILAAGIVAACAQPDVTQTSVPRPSPTPAPVQVSATTSAPATSLPAPAAAAPTSIPSPAAATAPTATLTPIPTPMPTPMPDNWPPIIDVHSHWQPQVTVETLIRNMDAANVLAAVMMPNGGLPFDAALELQRSHPDRFLAFLGFQNAAWIEQRPGFVAAVEERLRTGRFAGLGEVLLRHYAIPERGAPDISIDATAPDSLRVFGLAAAYEVPILIHMEAEEETSEKLRSVLEQNPAPSVIWAHAGRATAGTVDSFLSDFPNLYIDLSALSRDTPHGVDKNPITGPDRILTPEWRALLIKFQDRVFTGSSPGLHGSRPPVPRPME